MSDSESSDDLLGYSNIFSDSDTESDVESIHRLTPPIVNTSERHSINVTKKIWVPINPQPSALPGVFKYTYNFKISSKAKGTYKSIRMYKCGSHCDCKYEIRVKEFYDGTKLYEELQGREHGIVALKCEDVKNMGIDNRIKPTVFQILPLLKSYCFIKSIYLCSCFQILRPTRLMS